jgi:hypothetical protein
MLGGFLAQLPPHHSLNGIFDIFLITLLDEGTEKNSLKVYAVCTMGTYSYVNCSNTGLPMSCLYKKIVWKSI